MKSFEPSLIEPCLIWLLAYPDPCLVSECTATRDALRNLFHERISRHSGYREKEGSFRVNVSPRPPKFTLYADSTLHRYRNEFCQILYLNAEYSKGEYGTPGWKEHHTKDLSKDLKKFQNVLQEFARDWWDCSWLRYTVGNANGCKNLRTAKAVLGNVCVSLGREPARSRETHEGILARLAPTKKHASVLVGNCFIPRQIDLLYLQYTDSYSESNRWLMELVDVLRRITTYEIGLSLAGQALGASGTSDRHLLESCLAYVRNNAADLPRLYKEWGESFDTSLISFLGRGVAKELWQRVRKMGGTMTMPGFDIPGESIAFEALKGGIQFLWEQASKLLDEYRQRKKAEERKTSPTEELQEADRAAPVSPSIREKIDFALVAAHEYELEQLIKTVEILRKNVADFNRQLAMTDSVHTRRQLEDQQGKLVEQATRLKTLLEEIYGTKFELRGQ